MLKFGSAAGTCKGAAAAVMGKKPCHIGPVPQRFRSKKYEVLIQLVFQHDWSLC